MAEAAEQALGARLTGGIVVTKYDHAVGTRLVRVVEAGHPVPDDAGVAGASDILDLVATLGERDLVVVLLSGGGSALLVSPADGVSLADKQAATGALLSCGATINEINAVRKHLSRIKGGQLAGLCAPAHVVTLVLSDVIGDPLDVISSGPTVPDTSTFGDALAILDRYDLRGSVPDAVLTRLVDGAAGSIPETPKAGDEAFVRSHVQLIGTNRLALDAVAGAAKEAGYDPTILTSSLRGEAREVAKVVASLTEGDSGDAPPRALIFGGETTVTLGADAGKGGRNQELALAAAIEIAERDDVVVTSIGTDGTDGPTDAAGGLVDGLTVERARSARLSPEQALVRHGSYDLLKAAGDLVVTGPTGTNVMDVAIALVG